MQAEKPTTEKNSRTELLRLHRREQHINDYDPFLLLHLSNIMQMCSAEAALTVCPGVRGGGLHLELLTLLVPQVARRNVLVPHVAKWTNLVPNLA